MTTIVYTEEIMSSGTSGNPPGNPANVTRFLVEVGTTAGMGDTQSGAVRAPSSSMNNNTPPMSSGHRRTGSPKPATAKGRFSVKQKGGGSSRIAGYPSGYPPSFNPHAFTIVAYLPNDGGKRLKLHCTPGQTVQQVIESEMPEISHSGYQVYQFPSRALLNPEKEASVLQDQEISIEPMRQSSPVNDMGDERLMVTKELLRTEDTYLENLRNIFDIYMEPLKKWGLPQSEMNTMFRSLSRLCDLLMNFFSELELAVRDWNTRSTPIGGLFKQYRPFWDLYKEYSLNYAKACKLLKDKRASDESFNKFLELKRGAAMHTLESLMLLPVQRIDEYHKLLVRLSQLTPQDHPDYYDLQYTVTCVESIVQAREQQLNQSANEVKLNLVQQRFPNDNLNLDQSIEVIEQQSKRYKGYAGIHQKPRKSGSFGPTSMDHTDGSPMDRRRSGIRLYVNEGPVKIITLGMQSHDRHLFLFNDMLIIAKPMGKQSSKTPQKFFKRKEQLRLSEMWVSESTSDIITECSLPSDTTFVLGWPGWPITNCVAAFSTPEERKLWFTSLSKNIAVQRQMLQPERVSIQIVNLTKSSNNIPIWMQVHINETTNDVLSRALDQLAIAVAKSNCQMWVKISREGAGLQLMGHEHPFAIQNFHNRHQVDYLGDGKPVQLQMVIKRKTPNPPLKKNKSTFIKWPRTKPKSSKDLLKYKVFKAPLHMVITNDQLPDILQVILERLYAEGPHTFGIFRQSANHKKVKEYKEAIDNRAAVDLTNEGIHVLGALLKDFLRSVPGGILMSSRYTEFVATNDVSDISTRVQHIQKVINRLPKENQLFLQYLMPLLYRISRYEAINCMNSINLAICFAPSLLWPDSGLDVIKNEVPPLVQFMVEYCPSIFGEELPELYKQLDLPISPEEQMGYASDKSPAKQLVPTKREDGDHLGHKRTDSMDSSMSEGSAGEDMEESNLLRTRGLTYSDSQLSQISQLDEYDRQPPRAREFVVERRVAHKHPRQGFGASHHLRQEFEKQPQAKRVKKLQSKKPERSSSLHGTNDSPYSASARGRYRKSRERMEPSAVRRKSIATQTTLPRKVEQFVQQLPSIPQSSSSSLTSSSQGGYSPQIVSRTTTLGERGAGFSSSPQHQPGIYRSYVRHEEASPRHMMDKKRRVPQYSHSFSNQTENKPNKPLQTSNSFYDRLMPLEASVGPGLRAQFVIADDEQNKPMWRIGEVSQGQGTRQLGTPMASSLATHSNQSLASSKSGSSNGSQGMHYLSRPSNASLASSGSGGRGSPGTASMEGGPFRKPDRGHVKDMITSRFNIPPDYTPPSTSMSASTTTQSTKSMTRRLGTSYPQHEPMQLQEQVVYPTKSDGADSLERVRQKMNERKRLDSSDILSSDPSFIKSPSYQSFLSSHQKKDSLKSLTEEASNVDDRPESDQHLNSLPRPHTAEFVRQEHKPSHHHHPLLHQPHQMGMAPYNRGQMPLQVGAVLETVPDHDPNKLTVGSGYNSDTESSPSRTLNRAGKLNEVTTPTKTTIPQRYRAGSLQSGREQLSQQRAQQQQQQQQQQKSRPQLYQDMYLQSRTIGKSGSLPSSTTGTPSPPVPKSMSPGSMHTDTSVGRRTLSANGRTEDTVASLVADLDASTKATMLSRRPKSGDVSRIQEKFKRQSLERTSSNIEDAKIKLGLIPSPRQRSKSTSEREAMKVIHKIIEEDEPATRVLQDEERAEKHKEWISSAPTSAERRKAWEHLTTQQFPRSDGRTRSFRNEQGTGAGIMDKAPTILKPSITPELKRKSATMPDYLVTGSSRYAALRGSHVRTVKVTSYEVPEAKKVRKINLRTYH